jgi:hypothetical protein
MRRKSRETGTMSLPTKVAGSGRNGSYARRALRTFAQRTKLLEALKVKCQNGRRLSNEKLFPGVLLDAFHFVLLAARRLILDLMHGGKNWMDVSYQRCTK